MKKRWTSKDDLSLHERICPYRCRLFFINCYKSECCRKIHKRFADTAVYEQLGEGLRRCSSCSTHRSEKVSSPQTSCEIESSEYIVTNKPDTDSQSGFKQFFNRFCCCKDQNSEVEDSIELVNILRKPIRPEVLQIAKSRGTLSPQHVDGASTAKRVVVQVHRQPSVTPHAGEVETSVDEVRHPAVTKVKHARKRDKSIDVDTKMTLTLLEDSGIQMYKDVKEYEDLRESHILTKTEKPRRLLPLNAPCPELTLRMKRAVIIGSGDQTLVDEDTPLDVFLMTETLKTERNMFTSSTTPSSRGNSKAEREIEKMCLYTKSPLRTLAHVTEASDDLGRGGILLMYISHRKDKNSQNTEESLRPENIEHLTSIPLVLILEMENSSAFADFIPNYETPLLIIMAPAAVPKSIQETSLSDCLFGGLMTVFLYCPLSAICSLCNTTQLSTNKWEMAKKLMDTFMQVALNVCLKNRIDPNIYMLLGDNYIRMIVTKFIFFTVTLRRHQSFINNKMYLPTSNPPIAEKILDHPSITGAFIDIISYLKINKFFNERRRSSAGAVTIQEFA